MTDRKSEELEAAAFAKPRPEIARIAPNISVAGDVVGVEFRIEDLVRRVIPSAAGHCGGCYGCSGCSM